MNLTEYTAVALEWLDANQPDGEMRTIIRVAKVAQEAGEALEAWFGITGTNPRKGVCATRDDLSAELCDVIVTAMVALATVEGGAESADRRLTAHLDHLYARTPASSGDAG